jgi:lipopolysaccharide/colanic/teichoic acid biosynthesis glycosyltransferase
MSDSSTTTTKDDSPLAKAAAESSRLSAGAADMSRFHYRMFKRGLDISVAGFLLLLSPVWLLPLAILVKLDSRGPVFFRHSRIGRGGKAFDVLKFRTMVQDAERILKSDKELQAQFEEGFKIKDDPRVTRMGKLFRKLSLDELPQIINIFRGQMSFVGPRPIVESERYKYGDRFGNLTTVKPGITGLWQTSGRTDISYEERVALDMDYIEKRSLLFDTKLMLKTIWVMVARRGGY